MRRLTSIRVLFALLALQLALGLQISVATPQVAAPHPSSVSAAKANADPCPLHGASAEEKQSAAKHECCSKSVGCQCQCGTSSAALNVIAARAVPASMRVEIPQAARTDGGPVDPHVRPPIAP